MYMYRGRRLRRRWHLGQEERRPLRQPTNTADRRAQSRAAWMPLRQGVSNGAVSLFLRALPHASGQSQRWAGSGAHRIELRKCGNYVQRAEEGKMQRAAWASAPGRPHEKSISPSSGIEYFELSSMCCEKVSEGRRAAVALRTTSEMVDSSVALRARIGPASELTTSGGAIICVRGGGKCDQTRRAEPALGRPSTLWGRPVLCLIMEGARARS